MNTNEEILNIVQSQNNKIDKLNKKIDKLQERYDDLELKQILDNLVDTVNLIIKMIMEGV